MKTIFIVLTVSILFLGCGSDKSSGNRIGSTETTTSTKEIESATTTTTSNYVENQDNTLNGTYLLYSVHATNDEVDAFFEIDGNYSVQLNYDESDGRYLMISRGKSFLTYESETATMGCFGETRTKLYIDKDSEVIKSKSTLISNDCQGSSSAQIKVLTEYIYLAGPGIRQSVISKVNGDLITYRYKYQRVK